MRYLRALALASLLAGPAFADVPKPTPEQQAEIQKLTQLARSLRPRFGDVAISSAYVTLHLGKQYYFLPADQAKRVLTEAWNNAPEAVSDVQGMVFPAGKTFADDTWAAVITYQGDGYVSDSDAKSTDYDAVLKSARDAEDDVNEHRKSEGLEPMHLVGWAQPPSYDVAHHSLVWAREIRFGNQTDDTLNYDVRALGRRGVLSMNIVSTMSRLGDVRGAAAQLEQIATFDPGSRYTDFNAGIDKKAEYGIAGLIAAGIGVAAAQKFGLLALGLLFLKKAAVFVVAGFAGVAAWLRRLFRRAPKPPAASA
jgi:uncharacterized membrane-anchored protein